MALKMIRETGMTVFVTTYELFQMRIHRDILLIMSKFCTQIICFELLTIFVHPYEIYKVQKKPTHKKICTAFCQILLEVICCALIGLLPSSVQGECTTLQQCAM